MRRFYSFQHYFSSIFTPRRLNGLNKNKDHGDVNTNLKRKV